MMKKKEWKIEEKMSGNGCLVERGREREKWLSTTVFSLSPPKFNLSKMERK